MSCPSSSTPAPAELVELPSMAQVVAAVRYNPENGVFTRVAKGRGIVSGIEAGWKNSEGYVHLKINHRALKAHRLAWFLTYGVWPIAAIDHINGDRSDNRICNLREADWRSNGQNRREHRDGALVGASLNRKSGKWVARARINGKRVHIGTFASQSMAHQAYLAALGGKTP